MYSDKVSYVTAHMPCQVAWRPARLLASGHCAHVRCGVKRRSVGQAECCVHDASGCDHAHLSKQTLMMSMWLGVNDADKGDEDDDADEDDDCLDDDCDLDLLRR